MKTEIEFTYVDYNEAVTAETFHRVGMIVDNNTGQLEFKLDGEEKQIVGKVWSGLVPDRELTERENTDTGSGDQEEGTRD